MFTLLLPAAVAAIVSLALTPLVLRVAAARNFVDRPDGRRKVQAQGVALGGGVAIVLATLAGLLLTWLLLGEQLSHPRDPWPLIGLLAASLLLCLVGLFDDWRGLRGGYKLLWQVAAASLILGSGPAVDRVTMLGVNIPLGVFGYLLTMLWLLAAINSVNLIDGVDGLAAGVGLIFSFAVGAMAMLTGHPIHALIAFTLAGALAGFLPFNVPPAKIYLGDAGSMVVGLVLGTLALRCSTKEAATLAFAAPLALWAIPMFDSGVAIVRRWLTGRSIYTSDRGHIHHRLMTRGLTPWQAVLAVSGLCALTSAAAVASIYFHSELLGVAVVAVIVVGLVATRIFGHVELLLVNNQLLGLGRQMMPFAAAPQARHTRVRLQGTLAWEKLWESLVESADRLGLRQIRLHVSLPQMHEDYFAEWSHQRQTPAESAWSVSVPVRLGNADAGRLRIVGEQTWESVADQLREFLDFVDSLQNELPGLVREDAVGEQGSVALTDRADDSDKTPSAMAPLAPR